MTDNVLMKELKGLEKLLAFHIIKSGASPREVRQILKLSGTAFKSFLPIKKIKKYK